MNEMTSASAEQASDTAQVNTAVTHMDQMTQQNAALVEAAAAAAASMEHHAARLARSVAIFRLDEGAGWNEL
jgi:methyl-accepting chemotaxis protein